MFCYLICSFSLEFICFDFATEIGRGCVVVSALDFRSEGRWFEAQSLSSFCFLTEENLPNVVSLHPSV